MQTRTDKNGTRYAFASLAEVARYVENTPRTWSTDQSESVRARESWDLNTGYDLAVKYARDGWIEGAHKTQDTLKSFRPKTPKPSLKNDFYGHTPNVPRFAAGAPDSMIRHTRDADHGSGAVLTLVVPINALANVDAEYMANYGLAVAQYINQLETDGVRVELLACMACEYDRGYRTTHTWVVKQADQHLDLAVVSFVIGHPAMFRRIGFALIERCAAREHYGYGRTKEATTADLIDPAPGTYILNGMKNADRYAKTPEDALKYVTKEIDTAIANAELPA